MAGKESTPAAPSKPASTRQKVHIRVTYTGKGQPAQQLRERCEALVGMLVQQDAGTIAARDAGNGAVNVYVVTRFADHTIKTARQIVNELGLATRTRIALVDGKAEG